MPAESDDDAARHYSEHDVCHIYTPVCPPVPSDKGVTVVASFGLARFHRPRAARSAVNANSMPLMTTGTWAGAIA